MTNTIPNVPRELLADLLGNDHDKRIMAERHLLAMLANAPSPAGVDGLEVVAWVVTGFLSPREIGRTRRAFVVTKADAETQHANWLPHYNRVTTEPLCRLSDAQAIIDWLREDRDSHQRACIRAMEDRNQLAKCLKFARTTMSVVADNANLRGVEHRSLIAEVNRIDAALSGPSK